MVGRWRFGWGMEGGVAEEEACEGVPSGPFEPRVLSGPVEVALEVLPEGRDELVEPPESGGRERKV